MRGKVGESGGKGLAVVLMGVAAYSAYWSWLSITRFYDLFATYMDLGVEMGFMRQALTGEGFLSLFLDSPFHVMISPLVLFNSAPLLLVVQAVCVGAAAVPLYGSARHSLGPAESAALSLLYLVYFPLAPGNGFDLHMQVFFPLFFLLGYYLFLEKKYAGAAASFAVSASVRRLYAIFPSLFALLVIIDLLAVKFRGKGVLGFAGDSGMPEGGRKGKGLEKGGLLMALAVLAYSGSLLAAQYLFFFRSPSSLVGFLPHTAVSGVGAALYDLPQKGYTLLLLFLPLLFLPLLSKKWVLFYVPYLFALLYLNYWGYQFPFLQYAYGIAPFLFLGAIDGLGFLAAGRVGKAGPGARARKALAAMALLLLFFDLFYEPYGPLFSPRSPRPPLISPYYNNNANGVLLTKPPDMAAFESLSEALSLVPKGSTLSIENDMPEAYDEDVVWYPAYSGQDYALLDFHVSDQVDALWLYFSGYPYGNRSAMKAGNWLLSHGYGLYAELDGFVLLRANYSGPLQKYSPLVERLPASDFWAPSSGPRPGDAPANSSFYGPYDELFAVHFRGLGYGVVPEWYGPYSALPPGEFNVTFEVRGEPGEAADFCVQAYNGSVELASSAFVLSGAWQGVTLTVSSGSFYGWVGFGCSAAGPAVELKGVEVVQVAPPRLDGKRAPGRRRRIRRERGSEGANAAGSAFAPAFWVSRRKP